LKLGTLMTSFPSILVFNLNLIYMLMAEKVLEIIAGAVLVAIFLLAIAAAVGIYGAVAYKFFCMVLSIHIL